MVLRNLFFSTGILNPPFSSGTTTYTQSVPNSAANLTITPFAANHAATIKINTSPVNSGPSTSIPLNVGDNNIDITVTAQDGTTKQTYTVKVTREAPSTNTNLNLTISNGATSVTKGSTTTHALTVTNSGNGESAGTITIVDVLPSGLTIANGSVILDGTNKVNWSCTAASNAITCESSTPITGTGGASLFSFTVDVATTVSGLLVNKAQVGGGSDTTNLSKPNTATASLCTATNTPNEGCAIDSDTVN